MEDKRFQEEIPEDPSFEEMEEILREIKHFNALSEALIRIEFGITRF